MKVMRLAAVSATFSLFAVASAHAQQPAPQPQPATLAGEYVLAQADEAELPVLISEADGCRREITAATLTISAENRWTLQAQVRETCGDEVAEKVARQSGTFTTEADAMTFAAAPAEEAAADQAEASVTIAAITAASVAPGAIHVTYGEGEDRRTLIFRR